MRNTLVSAAKRRKKIARDILYGALGQHQADNAFFPISFGASCCGIFGSTPTDLMHALEEGIIKYITDTFLTPMPDSMASMLDAYVKRSSVQLLPDATTEGTFPELTSQGVSLD